MTPIRVLTAHAPRLAALSDRYKGELGCEWHWRLWRSNAILEDVLIAHDIPLDRKQRVAVALMSTVRWFFTK